MSTDSRIPVVVLVRVSTDKQSNDRQIESLKEYASKQDYRIVDVIEETVSGAAAGVERTGLEKVEEMAIAGRIKKVLVHEISRIGRTNSQNHLFLEKMEKLGVSIYWSQHNMETLLPDGARNPSASILFSLMSEIYRQERETLITRIKSGMDHARARGKHVGRPKGSTMSSDELLDKHGDIVRLLKRGQSVRHTAKITGKGTTTVTRVKRLMENAAKL